ncbi:MAG: hypothetical protein CMI61_01440 [Parvibaculum sp.]|nr:hypothetical protein [Parvibaculum sp.]
MYIRPFLRAFALASVIVSAYFLGWMFGPDARHVVLGLAILGILGCLVTWYCQLRFPDSWVVRRCDIVMTIPPGVAAFLMAMNLGVADHSSMTFWVALVACAYLSNLLWQQLSKPRE